MERPDRRRRASSVEVHFSVTIEPNLGKKVASIVERRAHGRPRRRASARRGSAHVTPIAPAYGVELSPDSQTDGAAAGGSVTYPIHIENIGANSRQLHARQRRAPIRRTVLDATCATPLSTITVASGTASTTSASGSTSRPAPQTPRPTRRPSRRHRIDRPVGQRQRDGRRRSPSRSTRCSSTTTTTNPDVQSYYKDALTAAGQSRSTRGICGTTRRCRRTTSTRTRTSSGSPATPTRHRSGRTSASSRPSSTAAADLFMSGQDILDQAAGTTAVRPRLPAHRPGTAPRPRTTRPPTTVTASPATRSPTASAPCRSTTSVLGADVRGPDHAERPGARRRSPTTASADRRADVQRVLQGRLPGLPARGVRDGRAEGRPDEPRLHLLRTVTRRVTANAVNEWGRSDPSPLLVFGAIRQIAPSFFACHARGLGSTV